MVKYCTLLATHQLLQAFFRGLYNMFPFYNKSTKFLDSTPPMQFAFYTFRRLLLFYPYLLKYSPNKNDTYHFWDFPLFPL